MQSIKIFNYLKEAETIFNEWTSDEASINGDSRDREPIIAIATMLQAEDHNKTKNNSKISQKAHGQRGYMGTVDKYMNR